MDGSIALPPAIPPAEVRHRIENLLAAYVEAVDAHNVAGVARLLSEAVVSFDAGTPLQVPTIAEAYEKAFAAGGAIRHLVFTRHVEYGPSTCLATVRVPYQRWSRGHAAPKDARRRETVRFVVPSWVAMSRMELPRAVSRRMTSCCSTVVRSS
jgi:hypothetical protein